MREERPLTTIKIYCEKYLNTDGMTEAVKEAWKDLTKFRWRGAKERILIQVLVVDFVEEAEADRYLRAFLSETGNLANESGSVECGEGRNLMVRYYLLRERGGCVVVFVVGFRGGPESVASRIDKSLFTELKHPDARRRLKSKDVLKALEGFRRGRACSDLVCRVLGALASTVDPCITRMIAESRLCDYCFR